MPFPLSNSGSGTVGYGSVEGTEKPSQVQKHTVWADWRQRGTILGIIIDVSGMLGSNAVVLFFMFWNQQSKYRRTMHCEVGGPRFDLNFAQAVTCEYTKGFIRCFPALALAVMLLLVSRDVLQKRLYYCTLQSGAVIDFRHSFALKDGCVWVVLISYLHMLLHMAFLASLLPFNTTVSATRQAVIDYVHKKEDAAASDHVIVISVQAELASSMVDLLTYIVLPSTLFLIIFFQAYDIHKSLVPLSEYVHGNNDEENKGQLFQSLIVIEDADLRAMLVEDAEIFSTAAEAHSNGKVGMITHVLESYKLEHQCDLDCLRSSPGLLGSLWSSRLLLSSIPKSAASQKTFTSGVADDAFSAAADQRFRWFWLVNFTGIVLLAVPIICHLLRRIYLDGMDVLGNEPADLCAIGVEAMHVGFVLLIFSRFLVAHMNFFR